MKKELRLQQLTFVIPGVYVAVWATVSLLERFWPSFPELPLGPISIGYFALQVAEAGLAGLVMSASGPMMIYPGTRVAAVSSNPIAFAIPRKNGRPYLLDFSTGVVANGKIMAAADRGEKIPIGWGVDKDGHDTTDPKAVENVLPMAGAKGAGL